MADKKNVQEFDEQVAIAKAKDFWAKYGKLTTGVSVVVILLAGGWYGYRNFIQKPKETKAVEMMFRAEEYYRKDSVVKALNGDGQNWGFLKVIDKYGGTKAGNLANFYAGSCFVKLNENEKAVKYLKKFTTDSKPGKAKVYKLLADAYADLGKNSEALDYYKKAAAAFEKDQNFSADCLFMAGFLAQKSMNDPKTATAIFQELKAKFPKTQQAFDAENNLAQMGVYNSDN